MSDFETAKLMVSIQILESAQTRIAELETALEAVQKDAKEQYAAGQQFAATNMKVRIPTATMEQEFQSHYRRGYAAGQRDEREACAVSCESKRLVNSREAWDMAAQMCANSLRARGEKP